MTFSITSKLNKKDYIKTMFIGLYKKPRYILYTVFGIYFLSKVYLDYLDIEYFYADPPIFELIFGLLLILWPSLIVLISVNQLKSSSTFVEDTTYTFSDDGIVVEATTCKSEFTWSHILKQKGIGNFLVLYHTNRFGNFIDKSKLTEDQLLFIKSKIDKK